MVPQGHKIEEVKLIMSPLDKGGGSTWTALFIGPCYRAGHTQGLRAMKGFAAALLIWTLLSPRRAGGEAWPTHTACRNGNLQVLYQSCGKCFLNVGFCLQGRQGPHIEMLEHFMGVEEGQEDSE